MELCPFCKRDPFHYVDNGIGYEIVAVNCCDLGIDLYSGNKTAQKILNLRRSYSPRKKARAKILMAQYA
jgi:hypothetical protein